MSCQRWNQIQQRRIPCCCHTGALLLARDISTSQCLASFITKLRAPWVNNAWSAVSPWGCPWDRSTQVAAIQDLRATTGQQPVWHGQDTYTGWWSLCGCEDCNLTKLVAAHLMLNKTNLLMPGCGKGKYSMYCRMPSKRVEDKPQIYSSLVFELGFSFLFFLKGKNKEDGINHHPFLNPSFQSQDDSRFWFSVQVVHDSGSVSSSCFGEKTCVCILVMISNNSIFSTLMTLLTS